MRIVVIAEVGINHGGSEAVAYQLIDAAVEAGADVAKFQLFKPELQGEHLRSVAFSREQIKRCETQCKSRGIYFACTAFDVDSLDWLINNTEMAFIKIGSGQANDEAIITRAIQSRLPVVQSIKSGYVFDRRHGFAYLHVIPEYPTKPENAHIWRLKKKWCSGLSDHSGDIFMPLAAAALGAEIIECHITLDKNQDGYDHKASLEPQQFKEMVRGIRAIEKGFQ